MTAGALAPLGATHVQASDGYVPTGYGYDISWPQCGGAYPVLSRGQFGVVGITDGHAFSENPCFASEYHWASGGGYAPSIYMNVNIGSAASGPCDPSDPPCGAYNYGYAAARDAFLSAWVATNGESLNSSMWWLDVETANAWSTDPMPNWLVIRGAIDYLHQVHRIVGVYSTPYMWSSIAGSYQATGVPNWVAGANGPHDYGQCTQPSSALWPGGQVWLFQYLLPGQEFDESFAC